MFPTMFFHMRLAPGESVEKEIPVRNGDSRAAHFGMSVADTWVEPESGRRVFPPKGTVQRGLGTWLSAPRGTRLRVPGKREVKVLETIKVPADAASGTYLGSLMFRLESIENDSGQEESASRIQAGVSTTQVFAVIFHVDVRRPDEAAPNPEVEIIDQEVKLPTESEPLIVRLRLQNKSKWEVWPMGTMVVLEKSGRPIGKVRFDPLQLWPEQKAWATASFSTRLPPGAYLALSAFWLQDPFDPQATLAGAPKRKLEFDVQQPAPMGARAQPQDK